MSIQEWIRDVGTGYRHGIGLVLLGVTTTGLAMLWEPTRIWLLSPVSFELPIWSWLVGIACLITLPLLIRVWLSSASSKALPAASRMRAPGANAPQSLKAIYANQLRAGLDDDHYDVLELALFQYNRPGSHAVSRAELSEILKLSQAKRDTVLYELRMKGLIYETSRLRSSASGIALTDEGRNKALEWGLEGRRFKKQVT